MQGSIKILYSVSLYRRIKLISDKKKKISECYKPSQATVWILSINRYFFKTKKYVRKYAITKCLNMRYNMHLYANNLRIRKNVRENHMHSLE